MADNTLQTGADTIATDDLTTLNGGAVSGVKAQRVKIGYGSDGNFRDVDSSNPLPVWDPDASTAGTITATDAVVGAHAGAGVLLSGTPTAASYVALALGGGDSVYLVQVTGTFGGGTVWFECSANSTTGIDGNWTTLSMRTMGTTGANATVIGDSTTTAGLYRGNAAGMTYLRVRVTGATTPSVATVIRASSGEGPVAINAALPAGTNTLGNVGIVASSSFTQTTGTLTTSTVPSNPNTTSTTSAVVANVALAGNLTAYLYGGTYTALTLAFEVSPDGTNWFAINAARADGTGTDLSPSFTAATIRAWEIVMPGVTYFRVRATAITQTVAPTIVLVPGGIVYDPSPVVTGSVGVNPGASGTLVAPVAGVAAAQTPPASGGTGTVTLTLTAVTAAASLIAAPGAGLSIYVTDMEGSNSGGTGTLHSLFEGTTNLRYARFVAASGGGYVTNLRTPWKLPANTAVGYASSAASTSNYLTVNYFVAP